MATLVERYQTLVSSQKTLETKKVQLETQLETQKDSYSKTVATLKTEFNVATVKRSYRFKRQT